MRKNATQLVLDLSFSLKAEQWNQYVSVIFVVTSNSQNCAYCKNSKSCDNLNNCYGLKSGTVCIADAVMHPKNTYGMASDVAINQTLTIFRIFTVIQPPYFFRTFATAPAQTLLCMQVNFS